MRIRREPPYECVKPTHIDLELQNSLESVEDKDEKAEQVPVPVDEHSEGYKSAASICQSEKLPNVKPVAPECNVKQTGWSHHSESSGDDEIGKPRTPSPTESAEETDKSPMSQNNNHNVPVRMGRRNKRKNKGPSTPAKSPEMKGEADVLSHSGASEAEEQEPDAQELA